MISLFSERTLKCVNENYDTLLQATTMSLEVLNRNEVAMKTTGESSTKSRQKGQTDMTYVSGGVFLMGSENYYPEERPLRKVKVDGFWIDKFAVTNQKFSEFVERTGYLTVAERALNPEDFPGAPVENLKPGSMLFQPSKGPVDLQDYTNWWRWAPGTSWRAPIGPGSSTEGLMQHPVVHVAYEDAEAYANWAKKQLPTEAEWEFAARGGHESRNFVWGNEDPSDTAPLANTWQGEFPWQNNLVDGYDGTAPVASYPANDFGLFEMTGNVWEWTCDWYVPRHEDEEVRSCCGVVKNPRIDNPEKSFDPAQPNFQIPRKVVKGGSYLCAPNYCLRYRPAARQPQMVDTGMSHIGFRCIVRD